MDYWNSFLSKDNFILAWTRINTATNISYKRFFRSAFLAYEVSLERNIECLIKRIKGGSYEPQKPDKIFIPKTSGLQRPITLLTLEDQIVWQALTNLLEKKFETHRLEVENNVVFSNLKSKDKKYFFEYWKKSYNAFNSKIKEIYKYKKWIVHFDLAAFYDTISHDHILKW